MANRRAPLLRPCRPHVDLASARNRLWRYHDASRHPLSTQQIDALHRIKCLHRLEAQGAWGPDLAYRVRRACHFDLFFLAKSIYMKKVFADLDVALFEGILRGNICLAWIKAEHTRLMTLSGNGKSQEGPYDASQLAAFTANWGECANSDGPARRILIALNSDKPLLDSRSSIEELLACLVHEMIVGFSNSQVESGADQYQHAYLLLLCGHHDDVDVDLEESDHGVNFFYCLMAVNETFYSQTGFYTVRYPYELISHGGDGPVLASDGRRPGW